MKFIKLFSTTFAISLVPTYAEIVYEDTFDAQDGIDINTSIGGGLISGTNITAGDPFDDATGDAVAQSNFGNRVVWAHTVNQFDLSGGFTLTVTFTTAEAGFPSFASAIAIVDEVTAATPGDDDVGIAGNLNALMNTDQVDMNAVGFSTTTRNDLQGLNADFGTLGSVSTALNSAIVLGTTQTFTLTVNPDGSAAFSLDDTSETLPAGTLSDLFTNSADGAYHFAAYSQGNTGFTLNSVSIDAEVASSAGFVITEIDYSPESDTVVLTWVSNPNESYVAKFSPDMMNWDGDLGDDISMANDDENDGDGDLLTKTFNLADFAVADFQKLFFRIEKE